jgi:hypothetical protein
LYKHRSHRRVILFLGVTGVNFMVSVRVGCSNSCKFKRYTPYLPIVLDQPAGALLRVQGCGDRGHRAKGRPRLGRHRHGGLRGPTVGHAAFQVYETGDGKRLGFQMHDMVGRPGRRVEVSVGNVHFLNKTNDITRSEAEQEAAEAKAGVFNKIAGTSHVPIFVKGMGGNVLIDSEGKFYDKERLVALFNATAPIAPEATQKLARQGGWQERARRTGDKKST